ncbi:acetate--CoA ligase family protein [Candidatus Nomurabacteria bacterium]|nr:acetate--CoA ligase family protein [Candidatus Nomurabacteria bacterium]MCB9803371.1 acetate--CoA ligase family protein [Candidatus Nomurabacteria bacterium]
MPTNIKDIFYPRSVAVVGVSSDPKKLGSVIFNNILKNGYQGLVYPVNPKYSELYGYQAYSDIKSIPHPPDLVVIVIPTEFVIASVKDCVRAGVKNLVIITAGFKEVGPSGAELEDQLIEIVEKNDMRLIGPNCLGIICTANDLNASFAAQHPDKGNIGFLSQSGAFNTAMLDLAENKMLGFNYFVSLGNKANINEIDLFEEWYKDDEIKVIGAYIEEFDDGRKLAELATKNRNKPAIVLNSGISEAGKRAVQSHTGSLAGSARAVKTALRQAGIIQVDSIEKMYSNLMMFSWCPYPQGDRVAVITNAGGPGIIITDILSSAGLKLATLSEESKKFLEEFLPNTASTNNPVDLLGDALADRYDKAIKIISKDPGVDSILVILTPQLVTQIEETAKVIIDFYKESDFPLIPIFIGEKYVEPGLQRLWENHIPAFQYDEEAIGALKNLVDFSTRIRTKKAVRQPRSNEGKFKGRVVRAHKDGQLGLPGDLTKSLIEEAGIDTPLEVVSDSFDGLLEYFKKGKYPVVIKATAEDIPHKTEKSMIYLNIFKEKDLERNYRSLVETIKQVSGNKKPNVLIQEQVFAKEEVILGINYDENFGHIILFGKGGIYTEVYNDTSTRLVYAGHEELEEMIDETRVSRVLHGARGLEKLPTDKIVKTLEGLQRMILRYPEIKSIDINPAMVTINRCVAVDVKIYVN